MKPLSKPKIQAQTIIGWWLEMVLDSSQELYRLVQVLDWSALKQEFGALYRADNGRPGVPIRLLAGLHLLKAHLRFFG